MKTYLLRLKSAVRRAAGAAFGEIDLRDAFVFGGLAAATYGIAQVHEPSAWIVAGTIVFILGIRR